ncbi:Hsp90 co-chaperone Cdc37 [Cordyceps militaris CM01]|uniref:Hsp90 chaperone protein kinase-targeting subunit n=1 Tax=Cordyceps militaris (strain CM01) TaxID=983644 RepID=G3J2U5_CORMM|nr:Hsp90 co-chaperone Cdc37 [Cordyceps militaris CM01]EGX97224.1 Hsp90 co-chaperone Cdc37 [Cordyceps militaris CM01]
MPVDYSKWDALELSDDSDIEVHPNVDKKSFIRAKQTQIHHERQQRKHRMEALKYEVTLHQALLQRIEALLDSLRSPTSEVAAAQNPNQLAFQAIMESAGKPEDNALPPVPEGLHVDPNQPTTYSAMMTRLLDEVSKTLEANQPVDRYKAMVDEIQVHATQVQTLIQESGDELAKLEKEEGNKITSEDIHTGFDSSFVNKTAGAGGDATKVELLNPNYKPSNESSSAKDASVSTDNDDEMDASPAARKFADIQSTDYSASLDFITKHPEILTQRDTDGLLVLAFDAALETGRTDDRARQCVHQALLLQYCRALGRDGVALFFKRITADGGNNAKEVFYKDVHDTHQRIRTRAREIIAERAAEPVDGVELIQLHAVEPGTAIAISVPEKDSEDPEVQEARKIYEHFSDEMRAALETGSLDKVNEVLGKLSVEDAEEYVNLFGEANILSLEEDIIDGTTEEGQEQIKALEAKAVAERAADAEGEATGDPE